MKKKKVCNLVNEFVQYYQSQFPWLWEWTINIAYKSNNDTWSEVAMCVQIQGYVRRATIVIHEHALSVSEKELELLTLHEICHLLMSDMMDSMSEKARKSVVNQEEKLCWDFAKSFVYGRDYQED